MPARHHGGAYPWEPQLPNQGISTMNEVEGRISKLDLRKRSAVITLENGTELNVQFPERMNVEIAEDETMGLQGGELEDLENGFEVEVELASQNEDGSYLCESVVCIS